MSDGTLDEDQVEVMARVIHSIAWPNVTPRDRDRDVWETCVRLARHALAFATLTTEVTA